MFTHWQTVRLVVKIIFLNIVEIKLCDFAQLMNIMKLAENNSMQTFVILPYFSWKSLDE